MAASGVRAPLVVPFVVAAVAVAAPAGTQTGAGSLAQFSRTLEELTDQVAPAVVQVFTSGFTAGAGLVAGSDALIAQERGSGSGVVLDPSGYIVTNAHVVAGATRIQVELAIAADEAASWRSILRPRGRLAGAQLVGLDLETDLAVLKVQGVEGMRALELADSDQVRPGQIVMAFGSPLGLDTSVSLGVVSAGARQIRADDPMIYIQTDASINPGNSGGPLVDATGRVVGISTFILSQSGGSEGIGFAAPSNIVRNVYEQIRQHGRVRRGEIGIRPQTITPALARGLGLAQESGVVLADVAPGGPADRAGLRVGDVVLALDGKPMENARQLQVNLYPRRVGESVHLDIARAGQRLSRAVSLAERPGDLDRFQTMVRPEEHLVARLGILALTLTGDLAALLPPLRGGCGVIVAAVAESSVPVRSEPILPGDVIYSVNQRTICGLAELRTLLDPMAPGETPVLQIERNGQLMFVVVQIE